MNFVFALLPFYVLFIICRFSAGFILVLSHSTADFIGSRCCEHRDRLNGENVLRLPFSKLICRSCCLALSAATLSKPWMFRRSVSVDDKLESCPPLGTFAAAAAANVE